MFTAPQEGVFVSSTTLSTVSRGERLATLGVLQKENNRKVEPCH